MYVPILSGQGESILKKISFNNSNTFKLTLEFLAVTHHSLLSKAYTTHTHTDTHTNRHTHTYTQDSSLSLPSTDLGDRHKLEGSKGKVSLPPPAA